MNKHIEAQRAKKLTAYNKAKEIVSKATDEDRELTDQEATDYKSYMGEIKAIDAEIERLTELEKIEKDMKEVAPITGRLAAEDDPRRGFQSFGEFALAVRSANPLNPERNNAVDERLFIGAAPTTFSNEGAGADGGFSIPPEFSNNVRGHMEGPDNFLDMTDDIPVQGNSMSFPTDETVPWGSDGVRAYWEGEGDQATQTKIKLGLATRRLKKLFALMPVTDELLNDATALAAWLSVKAGASIRYKANDALVNGDGVGKPLGILTASALKTVSKESAQSDLTVNATNVSKMYASMIPDGLSRAVWIVHHTVLPQLMLMSIANQPIWHADFRVAPGGSLLGRPVFISQCAKSLGTLGDIIFADWMKYSTIRKGLQSDMSMHLWFDYDISAFRVIFRIDGAPWLTSTVADANGSDTTSAFIALEERAGS